MPAPVGLTEQMRKFAEGLVAHGSATRAATEAGYKHPNVVCTRLAANPKVKAEVERLRSKLVAKRDKKTIADAEELQAFLTSIVRGEVKDYDLTLSGDVEEMAPKLETRRKAAMDLARIQGLIVQKNEHTGKDGKPIAFERYAEMSAAELEREAKERARVLLGGK